MEQNLVLKGMSPFLVLEVLGLSNISFFRISRMFKREGVGYTKTGTYDLRDAVITSLPCKPKQSQSEIVFVLIISAVSFLTYI